MDEKLLRKLLNERKEQDWYEFKRSLKIYQSDGKRNDNQRDELIKDILGLANGNSHIIRKTKYLIVGADNEEFDEDGCRVLHDVDYKVPTQSDLSKWLSSASSLGIDGLECEMFAFQGIHLFIVTIPPTFDLHETIRDLDASVRYHRHTIFIRQDENTVPASYRDGNTIQQLKRLHRQEIANPSASRLGALIGGIVGFVLAGVKISISQLGRPMADYLVTILFTIFGVLFGGVIGWVSTQMNETRYDWRYWTWRERIVTVILAIIALVVLWVLLR